MSSGGISLYREVLRSLRLLPTDTHSYYKVVAREGFAAHKLEDDPERIREIISRTKADLAWLVNKYSTVDIAAGR